MVKLFETSLMSGKFVPETVPSESVDDDKEPNASKYNQYKQVTVHNNKSRESLPPHHFTDLSRASYSTWADGGVIPKPSAVSRDTCIMTSLHSCDPGSIHRITV